MLRGASPPLAPPCAGLYGTIYGTRSMYGISTTSTMYGTGTIYGTTWRERLPYMDRVPYLVLSIKQLNSFTNIMKNVLLCVVNFVYCTQ